MENANLIKRFRETYIELSTNMTDDQALHWLEHHDDEYDYLVKKLPKKSFCETTDCKELKSKDK